MEIIPIFAPHLYAISYPKSYTTVWNEEICSYFEDEEIGNIDELKRVFKLWANPLYLDNFFFNNQDYLSKPYWLKKTFPIVDLPKITKEISIKFQEEIRKNKYKIETKFQPLNDSDTKIIELSKAKSKKNWLRLYAIKITDNRFIITGGAIKLTLSMQDHPLTNDEYIKLDKIKNFLTQNGVFDGDSFDDVLYENNNITMKANIEKFEALVSPIQSDWHIEADERIANKIWQDKAFDIALRVIRHMRENKISQVRLADDMGMKAQSLNRILQGKENLTLETICRIETALGINVIEVAFSKTEIYEVQSIKLNFSDYLSTKSISKESIDLYSIGYEKLRVAI